MTAEEDNFDIDLYGEGEDGGNGDEAQHVDGDYYDEDEHTFTIEDDTQPEPSSVQKVNSNPDPISHDAPTGPKNHTSSNVKQKEGTPMSVSSQGVKRKGSPNDLSLESGATTALMLSDLHWWITEDDIRGWVDQAGAEDDLKEVTFSEHKVNGKSKGQAYLDFSSPHASSAAKREIEGLTEGPSKTRKFAVTFTSGSHNPFKTSPKDAPARAKEERSSRGGSSAYSMGRGDFVDRGGYRGRGRGYERGGYDRGGHGGQGYNRNFSGSAGGYNGGGGFQGNMGMMNNFHNFNRGAVMGNNMRGNMGGMRGGRGGINNMMPPGAMGMGNMGMNPMMVSMGMPGFQGNQFGPGMFNQAAGPNFGGDWSQPGVKRQRQD